MLPAAVLHVLLVHRFYIALMCERMGLCRKWVLTPDAQLITALGGTADVDPDEHIRAFKHTHTGTQHQQHTVHQLLGLTLPESGMPRRYC